ncbi:MAG: 5-formyltetrahydrofolate cyclo-ligase [Firmicutes bacterium]|nr:5-formyltetrahydrofolate cyclo-ligase [Bacillota bacterium]
MNWLEIILGFVAGGGLLTLLTLGLRRKQVKNEVKADEIDTMKLIRRAWEAGKRVGVPRCIKMGEMVVQEIRSEEDLENGSYGIREPKAECPEIGGGEIDFVIVPCMTCSHDGRRLGYGGGFYDRFLSGIDVPMAVICREKIMRDDIIMEAHDRRIGIVVSEKGIERN